eukprot:TRINITY_DN91199_c0_g1_i1.p1 TRINITY_DN91199_c0_g1~~TRINITY_DN91199_c0_g1_i1.p1  ORF type:complete len:335 (+),score=23.07 TRINITY_DN91199_c0_g1_i1:105-1007(+)
MTKLDAAATVPVVPELRAVDVGDIKALRDAASTNSPMVLEGVDFPEGCRGEEVLGTIRRLCGMRKVSVRLPPRKSWLSSLSSSSQDASTAGTTFGDARASAPYSRRDQRLLRDVIDSLTELSSGREVQKGGAGHADCYAANVPMPLVLPELDDHFRDFGEKLSAGPGSVFEVALPGCPSLYLGAGEQRTPLHADPTENLTVVLQGSKTFRLYPPAAWPFLNPVGGTLAAMLCYYRGTVPSIYCDFDAWRSDSEGPPCLEVQLKAGQALYLPSMWWHAVSGSLDANVSLVYGYHPFHASHD